MKKLPSDMNDASFKYTGTQTLENMDEAVNYNQVLLKRILSLRNSYPSGSVLDFGAGIGTFAKLFRTKGIESDCLEIDSSHCTALKQEGFRVFEDTASLSDKTYNLIYSLNVLEHIEDDRNTLKLIHDKLRPDGVFFLYVPAFQMLYSDFDAIVGHCRRYNKSDLHRLLTESGFYVERIEYVDTLGFLAALVFKLLKSKPAQVTREKIWFFDRIVFPFNKITDPLFGWLFGKNIAAVCVRKDSI